MMGFKITKAHNKICFITQKIGNTLTYIESWHGDHNFRYLSYKDWIDDITRAFNQDILRRIFSEYYISIKSETDNEILDEIIEYWKPKILSYICKLYPTLKYNESGSEFSVDDEIVEIFNELLFD